MTSEERALVRENLMEIIESASQALCELDKEEGVAVGNMRHSIRMRSGSYFNFLNPQPDQFKFADIAGSVSKICRFGGQINDFYSVAEHLVRCVMQARQDGLPLLVQRAIFAHDWEEGPMGSDVVHPLKLLIPGYSRIARRVSGVLFSKYDVEQGPLIHAAIKKIDIEMRTAERRALLSADDVKWHGEEGIRELDMPFYCWGPNVAEMKFLEVAEELGFNTRI